MGTRQEELENELVSSSSPILVIVGAGLSIASTGGNQHASWTGLVRDGVIYCSDHCSRLPSGWADRRLAAIEQGDIIELRSVAEDVTDRLGYPRGGDYVRWLTETVGKLRPTNPGLIRALAAWNTQIVTTNYDSLIEQDTGQKSITWQDRSSAMQFLRGENRDVFHLHGLWSQSDTVILGQRSYSRILEDEHTQDVLRALLMTRTIVYVGCGAGLEDPNFESLLKWSQRVLSSAVHCHYRLACRNEVGLFQRQHPDGSRIVIIEYGESHSDLVGYLEAFAERIRERRKPPVSPWDQLTTSQIASELRRLDLESRKDSIGLGVYFREMVAMAEELWRAGGKRSAWMELAGVYDRESTSLGAEERFDIGLRLAQMMLDDEMADHAVPVLTSLLKDLEQNVSTSAYAGRFWELQSRCFNAICAYNDALKSIDQAIAHSANDETRLRLKAERSEIQFLQGEGF